MKSEVLLQLKLITRSKQTTWGVGVKIIMIRYVLFLQKGLNAEKIVV